MMNQTTSDINVNLADECKRLRARVNHLEGILENSENDTLRARFCEAETVKLAFESGAEAVDTFEDAIEYLRWYINERETDEPAPQVETVKLAVECGAEGIDNFDDAIEYLRWYTAATGKVTSPGIAIKGWPMSGFVNYKKQQRESD